MPRFLVPLSCALLIQFALPGCDTKPTEAAPAAPAPAKPADAAPAPSKDIAASMKAAAPTHQRRRCEQPAANGHGNARSVATVQSVVSNGGSSGGVKILSSSPEETIFRTQSESTDLVLGAALYSPVSIGRYFGGRDHTSVMHAIRRHADRPGESFDWYVRVRIRGANSLSLSNEPLYYIDGIRMDSVNNVANWDFLPPMSYPTESPNNHNLQPYDAGTANHLS